MADNEVSLDRIRLAEAAQAQRLARAQEVALHAVHAAREEAQQLLDAAAPAGRERGVAGRRQLLRSARSEADEILATANSRAEQIEKSVQTKIETAVSRAVSFILGETGR